MRLLAASGLECDESILTGESVPAVKSPDTVPVGVTLAELSSCLFMGTVVGQGSCDAVVVATGSHTQFGVIAMGLGEQQPQTEFQLGLSRFSLLLARVGGALSLVIFVVNIILGRPFIDSVLFPLAVAVGITPQLLPAVVSTSLATGSRRLARKKVLVKRLVGGSPRRFPPLSGVRARQPCAIRPRPGSSLGPTLGFAPLPLGFFLVLLVFVVAYLGSVELGKVIFFKAFSPTTRTPLQRRRSHRVQRVAARWSHHAPLPDH